MSQLIPSLLALVCTTLSCAIVTAQTPACFALNDVNTTLPTSTTSYGFAGQNTFGWQITPTNAMVVMAAQIFTRNTALSGDRFMILELWSDNAGSPGARLAGGAWRIINARPSAWQGSNLDQPTVLQANIPVWVVWIEPGFSTPADEPGGTTVPRATRSGTTWTVTGTAAPKLRLFCNPLDDAHSTPFGTPCAQSTGRVTTVFTNEQPTLGNAGFFFETSGSANGAPVFLVFGLNPTFVSMPIAGFPSGCMQHTDILSSILLTAGTGNTRGPTCAGYAGFTFALPGNPGLTGLLIAAQAAAFDAGAVAALPFGTSNAQRIVLY